MRPLYWYFRYLWRHRLGYCNICRKPAVFLLTKSFAEMRDHQECLACGSKGRNRHLAKCLVDEFRVRGIRRLSDFRGSNLTVYVAASTGSVASGLGEAENIIRSEYFSDCPPGTTKDGVLCQDIQRLTLADGSIDVVITEEVFEHVRDFEAGFREVYRVVKPGGSHFFTIPFYFGKKTKALYEIRDGEFVPVVHPVEYHGDPIRRQIPAYYRFGYDLFDVLKSVGFEVDVRFSGYGESIILGMFGCFTFVARKPGP